MLDQANEKEAKLEAFVQKWLDGEYGLSSENMEQTIMQVNDQIAQMRLRYQLGVETDKMVITGGVLSSNASESHLIGREKTPEEIELDKQIALSTLREKVAKKEITLAQASQLKNDISNLSSCLNISITSSSFDMSALIK